MTASAKANRFASSEAEGLAFLIDNFEIAFDAYRTVIGNSDFSASQVSLRGPEKLSRLLSLFKIASRGVKHKFLEAQVVAW
jgi:hypothetical protein